MPDGDPTTAALYDVWNKKIYSTTPDENILVHELTHASKPTAQVSAISNIMEQFGKAVYASPDIEYDEYLDDPNEIYARLMQLRHFLKVDPYHKFLEKEIKDLQEKYISGKLLRIPTKDGDSVRILYQNGNVYRDQFVEGMDWSNPSLEITYGRDKEAFNMLNRYNPKFIVRILNEVASAKKDSSVTRSKFGGVIKSKIWGI